MRLTRIKLVGFKSFVEPTTVLLPSNLIGVVGPNGCGKSNIMDAVRWVMGESSAKYLRGDSMSDVIFSGSSSRKPVGQASVELLFDNGDGSIGGEYASYSEISVKRIVSRDGQSVYYLNGSRCRRRDITDLFLGTGLGPRSYSIIQQDTISRLVEAKPEDLRVFLEEAAGISLYKERRRETESRIGHTRDNLDRLNDLREELEKQLAHLQRQARTAGKYKALKQQERLLKGQMQALRWSEMDHDARQREDEVRARETALEAQIAHQRSTEARIEKKRDEHTEATKKFNQIQSHFYSIGEDIARLEQNIRHTRERHQQQSEELQKTERSWNEAQQHRDHDTSRINELRAALGKLEPQLKQATQTAHGSAARYTETEQTMQGWQQEWEAFNLSAAETSQSVQVEHARIQQLEGQLQQYQQRLNRLAEERDNLHNDTGISADIDLLHEQIAASEKQNSTLREALVDCQNRIAELREQSSADGHELDRLRTELQHTRGRHASLEALQQAALGKRQKSVTEWLTRQGLNDARRLAEGITVSAGWEKAVECVLGDHLEAVCVDGITPLLGVLESLENGSMILLDTATTSTHPAGRSGTPLAEKITSAWEIGGPLSGIYAAQSLEEALALHPHLLAHESVITQDGIWLGCNWLRVVRESDEHSGVIHREQDIKALTAAIAILEEQVEQVQRRQDEGRVALHDLEQERETHQTHINEASRIHSEMHSQLSAKQVRFEQTRQRHDQLASEERESSLHRSEAEAAINASRSVLHQALKQAESHTVRREELQRQREVLRQDFEQARQQSRDDRDAAHTIRIQVEAMRAEQQTKEQGLERITHQIEQMEKLRTEIGHALAEGDKPIKAMDVELEALLGRRLEVEGHLADERHHVEEIDHMLRSMEKERSQAEHDSQDIRTHLERARMAWQELNVRCQTLQEHVAESGFQIETLLKEMPEDATATHWQEQVTTIEQRIARLGPINLAAIKEYDQQLERKTYLDDQHTDLMEALQTLESAIRKIDRETRTRFKETFEKVSKGLQDKFPRLFGGGHAYLELTGEDLLHTGITVMACPPGKRNSTIHLLSGGEKALTAVALIFAIFDLNPSPFCMLDEVDAPLDDANIGRFCEMVKEMSGQVQFIFVTHNKATMELADHLAGVTMHEPGVSRLVAVDVEEAARLAAV